MSWFAEIFAGGAEGLVKGVGTLAKDLRTAITGEAPLTSEQRAELLLKVQALEEAALQADQAIITGQLEVNKVEAGSGSFFRGGWRPAVGWVCVAGLGYTFVFRPLGPWVVGLFGVHIPEPPALQMDELMTLLGGMLGLGGFRTFERVRGKA